MSKILEALNKIAPTVEEAVKLKGKRREEYLKLLDAQYGDKAKRAKDLGFGDRTWYHGTTVPIDEFKNTAKGLSTGAQSAKKGFFFASDPSTASDYADLAQSKGVVREGDNVTTKWLSEKTYENPAEAKLKDLKFDLYEQANLIPRLEGRLENTKIILDRARKSSDPLDLERLPDLEKSYQGQLKYVTEKKDLLTSLEKQFASAIDSVTSGGQNVGAYRLKGQPDNIHVKDYKDQGYRDSTYADEMQKAQESGKTGVLFKNTYDPADPSNRVKQDIAAVFEPNQIRSTNAAFDPRFKNSPNVLALNKGSQQGIGTKILDTLAAPQRYASSRLAEAIGLVPKKSSEENFQDIAQAVAEKISEKTGINPDSPQANAIKAIGVAGAEVFADPLGFVPVGKISKGVKAVGKSAAKASKDVITPILQQGGRALFKQRERAKALESAVEKLQTAKAAGETVGAQTGVNIKPLKDVVK
jgi:hypothetical protein